MANKINEIIEAINGSETVEGLSTRVDNLEDNLDAFEEQTNNNFANLENWVVVSNEDEIFDTIDGKKYFKHDTFLYFNYTSAQIRGYFVKGFPKKNIRISSAFIESLAPENLGFITNDLRVTNDDKFLLRTNTLTFDFNQTPIRSQNDTELWNPEYGTSYEDSGDYGKILMFVRSE